ncbi:HicB family protein [Sporobacter termitidis DSM 10068]|uniref:HicB family protein n=1 Tax=Sporobacter termitidis DSM 10068 TaxID=1123282 RepID=A0A1M5ZI32_9FIRM|nr:toxin-antitoxin system HicB family antitoxin [Sporobacter termitidis]SHI23886.1 HicB family protein [Sporobacter termitidis DSM 10068]
MATDKYPTYVRIDRSIHEKLEIMAQKEHRSVNSLIVHLILKGVEDYEAKNGEVKVLDD